MIAGLFLHAPVKVDLSNPIDRFSEKESAMTTFTTIRSIAALAALTLAATPMVAAAQEATELSPIISTGTAIKDPAKPARAESAADRAIPQLPVVQEEETAVAPAAKPAAAG